MTLDFHNPAHTLLIALVALVLIGWGFFAGLDDGPDGLKVFAILFAFGCILNILISTGFLVAQNF